MSERFILDAGPLGKLTHPRPDAVLAAWADERLARGDSFIVPEIADYEIRRELLRAGKSASVRRLDEFIAIFEYLPLTTIMMRRAAEIWAQARRSGVPTASREALDGDVILAAQADAVPGAIIITENVRHIVRFVPAKAWTEVP